MFIPKSQCNQKGAMMWGMFSYHFSGPLVRVEGKIDYIHYIDLLKDYMIPEYTIAREHYRPIWQQDGAPSHRHHNTIFFLESHGIDMLKWPACSPDLSPIEDLWAIMSAKIKKMHRIHNIPSMVNKVMELWNVIPQDLLCNLADSFRERCESVVEKDGDLINKFYL